jgi:hypothetical protein
MAPERMRFSREAEGHHMPNKVNFNTGGMIKVCFLVAFLILLSGSVQASPQRLKIFVFGKSNSKTAEAIEHYLKNRVAQLLMDQYPCAGNLTDDDAAALLGFERERQLLGAGDPDALSNIANALGAQFVVSINVIQINGTFTMNATGLDDRRGKAVSKQAATAHSEDEALDAAGSLAEKFASDLINSMPDCYVNEWVGTITYSRVFHGKYQTTEDVLRGKRTEEMTSKTTTDADFEVRGTKKPAKAFVKWAEQSLKNTITKQTFTCPGTTPFEQGKTVTRNVTEVETATGNAEGKVDAVASVSVNGDEYTISFTVPEIDGGIGVRDWTLKDSGGCGPPESKHENNSIQYTTQELYEQAKGKIDRAKPDVLTGSQTVSGGLSLAPGAELTTIITWNLTFARNPSLRKK